MVKKNFGDDDSGVQNTKESLSRCSSTYFRKIMNILEPKLNDTQRARLVSTPFGKWLKMPKLPICSSRVDVVLKSFNSESSSFILGKGIIVPFTAFEFSIVLGLPYGGQPVNQDLQLKSNFLSRHFEGKLSKALRKKISENLLLLAESDDESHLDDFVIMFIFFSLNCIVFPLSTYLTPRFVFSYIDDLPHFFEYSWGDATYRFLCEKVDAHSGVSEGTSGRTTYLDGCIVGMMACLYEKIPSLGVMSGCPRTFPRLFKWGGSKIPIKVKDAETLLQKITHTKVFDIISFGEELELFGERCGNEKRISKMKEEETTCKIRRLEKLIEDQFNEIQALKKMCCEGDGMMKNNVDVGMHDELDDSKNEVQNVHFLDMAKDFDEDLGGYDERHDADFVTGDGDGDGDGNVDGDDVGVGDGVGVGVGVGVDVGIDVAVNMVGSEDSLRGVDKSDDGSGAASSQKDSVNKIISSIVKNVMTRTDRVKKRKENMFVTPPSSTPRRKKKITVEDRALTVICDEDDEQQISDSLLELKLQKYRGREDFCGCEEVSDEGRKMIMDYLTGEKLCVTVWEGGRFIISGPEFCDLLFGNSLKDDIIDSYMQIVSGDGQKNGFEIFCMDTPVQTEVLGALQRLNRKRMLKDDGYSDFLSNLTNYSREKLEELNRSLF